VILRNQKVRQYQNRPIISFEGFSKLDHEHHQREMRFNETWSIADLRAMFEYETSKTGSRGWAACLLQLRRWTWVAGKAVNIEPIIGSQWPTGPRPQTVRTMRSWIPLRHWCYVVHRQGRSSSEPPKLIMGSMCGNWFWMGTERPANTSSFRDTAKDKHLVNYIEAQKDKHLVNYTQGPQKINTSSIIPRGPRR
jgi:hypothetical protein